MAVDEILVKPEQAITLQIEVAKQVITYKGCRSCLVAVGFKHVADCPLRPVPASRCPKCHRPFEFWPDGSGNIIKMHPVSPCVPPKHTVKRNVCVICGGEVAASRPGAYQLTCKKECAAALFEREKLNRVQLRWREKARLQDEAIARKRKEA